MDTRKSEVDLFACTGSSGRYAIKVGFDEGSRRIANPAVGKVVLYRVYQLYVPDGV